MEKKIGVIKEYEKNNKTKFYCEACEKDVINTNFSFHRSSADHLFNIGTKLGCFIDIDHVFLVKEFDEKQNVEIVN